MVLGVSLGGHATWHCILHDSRISTGVIVIGCPDYLMLMKDRARLSKLKTWTETSPPGSGFVGSADFPKHLVDAVDAYDPAGVFLGPIAGRTDETYTREPTAEEKQKLIPLMAEKLCGKRILNLAGGADKLVPYAQGAPFLQWLKRAIATDGWFKNNDIVLKDMVFDGVGHAMTPAMVKEAVSFMTESLEQAESRVLESSSKI
ncbi:MAG: hypothetical protein LQ340_003920 [Diploschistes diacapsis]|nr:MAG: hypothetical protein LQ340_003920 [Diploschistes diacapsis]